jgi:hypothetical protein
MTSSDRSAAGRSFTETSGRKLRDRAAPSDGCSPAQRGLERELLGRQRRKSYSQLALDTITSRNGSAKVRVTSCKPIHQAIRQAEQPNALLASLVPA